jgi:acetyl-CoA carboxylase biotin carboxyl carrier protein
MSLSHEDVKRLLELLDASKFDELHLETDGTKLTLRRNGAGSTALPELTATPTAGPAFTATSHPQAEQAMAPTIAPITPPVAVAKTSSTSALGTGLIDVRASMLGQFYGAPKPGAAPFVTVGSKVQRDTAIGIIEVMKLMNSISAGVDGEVVEILARDGDLVEFDQVLMRVRSDSAA